VFTIERSEIFRLIEAERDRQDKLHPIIQKKKDDDNDTIAVKNIISTNTLLAVLMEEIGEVAKALQGDGDLKEELVQSAAVCVRWLEYLK
jgi:NTP pyrophosphatase (non-canonical NTP hydrolase)